MVLTRKRAWDSGEQMIQLNEPPKRQRQPPTQDSKIKAKAPARPKARRGKKGAGTFLNLPLDILPEICKFLHPRDILSLARTTKGLRGFLMSRSNADVWQAALLRHESIPPFPSWMNEPQHISLLYSPHCHGCGKNKKGVETIIYDFRARYCGTCRGQKILEYTDDDMQDILHCEVPYEEIFDLIDDNRGTLYHRPQILAFVQAWDDLPRPAKKPRDEARGQEAKMTSEQEALVAEWKQRAEEADEYTSQCSNWVKREANAREDELKHLRQSRLHSIITRTKELGYEKELSSIGPNYVRLLDIGRQMKFAKVLTEEEWSERMRDRVVALMDTIRAELLAERCKHAFSRRMTVLRKMIADFDELSLPEIGCKPSYINVALLPEVRQVVELPPEDDVDWAPIQQQLPNFLEGLQAGAKEQLQQAVAKAHDFHLAEEKDPLDLAVAFFQCVGCKDVVEFPYVIAHGCHQVARRGRPSPERDAYESRVIQTASQDPWSVEWFKCIPSTALQLLSLCGKDPASTTKSDMDELNARFSRSNDARGETKYVYTWRHAIDAKPDWREPSNVQWEWTAISRSERAKVNALEVNLRHVALRNHYRGHWACALCMNYRTGYALSDVKTHLKNKHGVDDPNPHDSQYVYRLPSAPYHDIRPDWVALIPDSVRYEDLRRVEIELLEAGRATYY